MKIANRLKRDLPKFSTDPTFVRGVNGRPKFRKKWNEKATFSKKNKKKSKKKLAQDNVIDNSFSDNNQHSLMNLNERTSSVKKPKREKPAKNSEIRRERESRDRNRGIDQFD